MDRPPNTTTSDGVLDLTKRVLNKDEIPECKCNRGEDWTEVCGICCENRSEFKGSTNYYGMSLTKGEVIDARACGGIARFANHSCNPNCVVERWERGKCSYEENLVVED
ncbi:hypothetical protein PPTG_22355 [Phytophthora nicotianae INRA-310]|uniref:SET domain-containing protein n=1 Tax=Phytophthora nicotianae (strain INRA-310) TaxID=761204 RepID=W2QKJ4_PHYN3|nr:hypothetical protein PPTG_22355 [Phytophthora nicotianae INRA-310]ETN13421.1 hypothetical protein PPTG_22355 [Phytophthora nicotianae INRA-310]